MNPIKLRFRSVIPVPAADLYAWHGRPGAFDRLSPPWQRLETIDHRGAVEEGDWRIMRFNFGPSGVNWLALHRENEPDRMFSDEQIYGPFAAWRHVHRFDPIDAENTILIDELTIRLPLGPLSHPLFGWLVRQSMRSAFRYRHLRTRLDVVRHYNAGLDQPLHVAVLGGGDVARQVATFLSGGGHTTYHGASLPSTSRIDAIVDVRDIEPATAPRERAARLGDGSAGGDLATTIRVVPRSNDRRAPHEAAAGRSVTLRTGEVLTAAADPLRSWLRRARFGLPVPDADASGPVEWIALDDVLGAILIALADRSIRGTFDVAAPRAIPRPALNTTLQRLVPPAKFLARGRAVPDLPVPAAGHHRLPEHHLAFPRLEGLIRFETGIA